MGIRQLHSDVEAVGRDTEGVRHEFDDIGPVLGRVLSQPGGEPPLHTETFPQVGGGGLFRKKGLGFWEVEGWGLSTEEFRCPVAVFVEEALLVEHLPRGGGAQLLLLPIFKLD